MKYFELNIEIFLDIQFIVRIISLSIQYFHKDKKGTVGVIYITLFFIIVGVIKSCTFFAKAFFAETFF